MSGNINPVDTKFTERLSHVLADLGKNGIFIALIAVVVLFSFLTNGILLRPQNISNLVVQNGYILVLAIGMVMVIIAGHIDLSVGSVAAFVGACSGVFAVQWGLPWWLSILSLVIGALVGVWQGFWIAFVGIPAFIVTLAGMLIFRGLALVVLGNANIGSFPTEYRALGNGFLTNLFGEFELDPLTLGVGAIAIIALIVQQVRTRRGRQKYGQDVEPMAWFITKLVLISAAIGFFAYSLASYKGIPITLIILAVLILVYGIVMNRTVFGRHIYAIGGNRHAADLSGIKSRRIDFWLFVNMGVLSALAGLVFTGRLNSAGPGAGRGESSCCRSPSAIPGNLSTGAEEVNPRWVPARAGTRLPDGVGGTWESVFTGEPLTTDGGSVPVAEALGVFPVAVLIRKA